MRITCEYKDMDINVELEDRVCCLHGDSGEGKTFLFKILRDWFACKGMQNKFLYIDYANYCNVDIASPKFQDKDALIIFDNADLYRDIVSDAVHNSKATIIVVIKTIVGLFSGCDFGRYAITHSSNEIDVRKKHYENNFRR